jgi:hypothetical protein
VWQSQLWEWEEMMGEALLSTFTVQAQSSDRWQWQPDPTTCYYVWDSYQLLTSHDSVTLGSTKDLMWHK